MAARGGQMWKAEGRSFGAGLWNSLDVSYKPLILILILDRHVPGPIHYDFSQRMLAVCIAARRGLFEKS